MNQESVKSLEERSRRWRLVLGGDSNAPDSNDLLNCPLNSGDMEIDQTLEAIYGGERKGGMGNSSPKISKWLGDIRRLFPKPVVQLIQRDALTRLQLDKMLLQPELLETVEADVHLVTRLIALKNAIPQKAKEAARSVVRKVVEDVERRLKNSLLTAAKGALAKSSRTNRPRPSEIDWNRTLRKNLKNYLPEIQAIIPQHLVVYRPRQSALKDLILCVDQSGSMAESVVYSSIFASVMASMKSLSTQFVVFDTEVADLTAEMSDPVDLLFGAQLGGGTDINRAIAYCQQLVTRPQDTTLILVTDLYEGGDRYELVRRIARLHQSGVNIICLLALSDSGAPIFENGLAAEFAALQVPSFACTPDLFPEMIAAALDRRDMNQWAGQHDLTTGSHRSGVSSLEEHHPDLELFLNHPSPNLQIQ